MSSLSILLLAAFCAVSAVAAPAAASVAAVGCEKGTYFWGPWQGKKYCVKCPKGETSDGCTECARDPFHKQCYPEHDPMAVQTPERKCKPGKYMDNNAKDGCLPCPMGAFSNQWNTVSCEPCGFGTVMPGTGAKECLRCDPGQYVAKKGQTQCVACNACQGGEVSTSGGSSAANCECTACKAGRYTVAGYNKCFACPKGRFQPSERGRTCLTCAAGEFQPASGKATCFDCPVGKTTATYGDRTAEACTTTASGLKCEAGRHIFYSAEHVALYCVNCRKGQYGEARKDFKYGGVCHQCAAGRYQPFEGRTTCLPCPRGTASSVVGDKCVTAGEDASSAGAEASESTLPAGAVYLADVTREACNVGDWAAWEPCSATCGTGHTTRKRTVTPKTAEANRRCLEASAETAECTAPTPCPAGKVDCKTGDWTREKTCDASCEAAVTDYESWTRKILVDPQNGGSACPATTRSQQCNVFPCPVHCTVSDWGGWGTCPVTCGAGTHTKTRSVTRTAAFGGNSCGGLSTTGPCSHETPCPQDCVMEQWGSWTLCSQQCGVGTQERERGVEIPRKNTGKRCGAEKQVRSCLVKPCPMDCIMTPWGSWSKCTAMCGANNGKGFRERARGVQRMPRSSGAGCSHRHEKQGCGVVCPVDCKQRLWGAWSGCSRTCGTGYSVRTRWTLVHARNNGKECGPTKDVTTCGEDACPIDCIAEPWGAWGKCEGTCGWGSKLRVRSIQRAAQHGGKSCGPRTESGSCTLKVCPVPCQYTMWSRWSACSHTCGTAGTKTKFRVVKAQPKGTGAACQNSELSREEACDESNPCPVHCQVSQWGNWDGCTKSCNPHGKYQGNHHYAPIGDTRQSCKYQMHCNQGGNVYCSSLREARKQCDKNPDCTGLTRSLGKNWNLCRGLQKLTSNTQRNQGIMWLQARHDHPTKLRSRSIVVQQAANGTECPALEMKTTCNEDVMCPINCEMKTWGDWSPCSRKCGTGYERRVRGVKTFASYGGAICEHQREERACATHNCPIACVMSTWTTWDTCDVSCGGAKVLRRRSIDVEGSNGGTECTAEPKTEERSCNTKPCPVDCSLGDWSGWTTCTAECGEGTKQRNRPILTRMGWQGEACKATYERKVCNTQDCPVPCEMNPWTKWGNCSKACGVGGQQTRTRSEKRAPDNGAPDCPINVEESRPCFVKLCAINCQLSDWSSWTDCDVACGTGFRHSKRYIKRHSAFGGTACNTTHTMTQPCDMGKCAKNCKVEQWGGWSPCVRDNGKSCGPGSRERTRNVIDKGHHSVCPLLKEVEVCGKPCAVDCQLGDWSGWSPCSETCDGGHQQRHRDVQRWPQHKGSACGPTAETQSCALNNCPVNEKVGQWGNWSKCSLECGGGRQTRIRSTEEKADFGGKEYRNEEGRMCNTKPCTSSCVWGPWGSWSTCSKSCGTGGKQRKYRGISRAAVGMPCDVRKKVKKQSCTVLDKCPVNCVTNAWSTWSGCTKACGVGTRQRWREITTPARDNGRACFDADEGSFLVENTNEWALRYSKCAQTISDQCKLDVECAKDTNNPVHLERVQDDINSEHSDACPHTTVFSFAQVSNVTQGNFVVNRVGCSEGPCAVNCTVSEWSKWGPCSKEKCGGGSKIRTRTVRSAARYGGQCPFLVDTEDCNTDKCLIDCLTGPWLPYGKCSQSCAGGEKKRVREIYRDADGGSGCGTTSETTSCNEHDCPADCEMNPWGDWEPLSGCTKSCGGGFRTKYRTVKSQAVGSGVPCTDSVYKTEVRELCNKTPCDVDCKVTKWSDYSPCSAKCGTGRKTRSRSIQVREQYSGKPCSDYPLREDVTCNLKDCPIDCRAEAWNESAWGECDAPCGWGKATLTRSVKIHEEFLGKTCEEQGIRLTASKPCKIKECPVDCVFSNWTSYSDCSVTCANGFKSRSRSIRQHDMFGGATCTGHKLKETVPCSLGICPVNCEVSDWGGYGDCTRTTKSAETVTCGGGFKTRKREVKNYGTTLSHSLGRVCPSLSEVNVCGTLNCPKDCILADWASWSNCNSRCGTGSQHRHRGVKQWRTPGGKRCGTRYETKQCNTHACPLNCLYSSWDGWSNCDKNCGGGRQTNHRSIRRQSVGTGLACQATRQDIVRPCNTRQCLDAETKCVRLFARVKAEGASMGSQCFKHVLDALKAGETVQGTPSGPCLWKYFTPVDARNACPSAIVTLADVKLEFPECEQKLLDLCHEPQFDCRTDAGAELAQGSAWNADSGNPTCPSPGVFQFANTTEFQQQLAKSVDINVATVAQLAGLYGVNSVAAGHIKDYRDIHGHFSSVNSLTKVQGFSVADVKAMFEHASPTYAKPVAIATSTAPSNICTYGDTKVINWWTSRTTSTNVVGEGRTSLGSFKVGDISGSVDLQHNGPWLMTYDVTSAGARDRVVTDEAITTINDVIKHVRNDGSQIVKQVIGGSKLKYDFSFRSFVADASKHLGIGQARMSCIAKPEPCVMEEWGGWGSCSRACSHETGDGGGLQYRSRGVKTDPMYGGPCNGARQQKRTCGDHECKWSTAVEAEDGKLAGCALFDNAQYATTQTSHAGFKGSGYISMDAGGQCTDKSSSVTWNINVPKNGHYRVEFRYATDGTVTPGTTLANDQIRINNDYAEAVTFATNDSSGYSDWMLTSQDIDLFQGMNDITLKVVARSASGAKPHIDRMVISQLETLERCTPGVELPLKWAELATESVHVQDTARGVKLGPAFSGTMSGTVDLGALGPWSIEFDTHSGPNAIAMDTLKATFNKQAESKIHSTVAATPNAYPIRDGRLEFKFHWEADGGAVDTHMELFNGYAVCQGCSDVTCTREKMKISALHGNETHYRIRVKHPHPHRSGLGVAGSGELHGNHHVCAWNDDRQACGCTCTTEKMVSVATKTCKKSENKYKATSSYKDENGNWKMVERCQACPYGKTVDDSNKCQWPPQDVPVTNATVTNAV
eukprot:g2802.t1